MPTPTRQSSLLGFFTKAAPAQSSSQSSQSSTVQGPAQAKAEQKKREPETPAPETQPTPKRRAPKKAPVSPAESESPPPSSPIRTTRTRGGRNTVQRRSYVEAPPSDEEPESDAESAQAQDEFVLSEEGSESSDNESAVNSADDEPEPQPEPEPEPEPEPISTPASKRLKKDVASSPMLSSSPVSMPMSSPASNIPRSHMTKAEQRALSEKRKRVENEQAYGFLLDVRDKDGNRPGELNYDKRTLYIPPSAWSTFTPFEKQFWELKQDHFDTILFFQKGKFYELYEEDAMIGHRECDLKLTDRVKMKMVGVPEASFDMFATKLLALGYKVGRVDQAENAIAKGMRVGEKSRGSGSEIVRRELRHVVTSGTIVDGSVLSDDLSSYCISIKEISGGDEPIFGICTLDASTAEFRLTSFRDDAVLSRLETLLRALRIKEVLHEKGELSPSTLRLVRHITPPSCQTTMLKPGTEFLDAPAARGRLLSLFNADDPESLPPGIVPMLDDEAAISALGAILWYLEQLNLDTELAASGNFGPLAPPGAPGVLILDAKSLAHLNVLQNDEGTDAGTLLRLLNRCITPFGRRLFKTWLASPLVHVDAINARLDAVDDLLSAPHFSEVFASFAKPLPDLERLSSRAAAGKIRARDFLGILRAFSRFGDAQRELIEAAEGFRSGILDRVKALPDVTSIAKGIRTHIAVEDDGSFAPKKGEYEPFDQAEALVAAAEQRLEDELSAAADELGLKRRDLGWKHIGTNEIYQLEVPARTKVPANWIIMSQTKACKRYYTPRGKELVRELKEAKETRVSAVRTFHADIYEQFRAEKATFSRAVRLISEIDCLISLAKSSAALGMPACRPELVESDAALLDVHELRHPCMGPSALAGGTEFIPNDIALGGSEAEVMVLTGGNMAGKSTTARTAATAVILAQLGCYVPATSARIAPIDRISSRMGANDQLFRNNSTFMVEMLEAAKIVKEATPRSLVIMDELGRGTSTFDGQAIAFAVLHHLVARTRCLCFFMTHYTNIAASLDMYPRVVNRHMEVLVDDEQRSVVFTYRLTSGIAESSYGTQVAALAGVPSAVCARAADVSRAFFDDSAVQQARRRHSRIALETLSDFSCLWAVAHGKAHTPLDVMYEHASRLTG